jgi:flavin reductase (DIM6/NTAB) family NADH-FMN oxidoreductase RutF
MNFDKFFKLISPEEIFKNELSFFGEGFPIKGYPVITAGNADHYNSLTASGGGLGLFFRKPTTWCLLRTDRYTLELIQKEQSYTMSYFPEEYKTQVLFLGSKSGRISEKMKEVELTGIQTPSGNMSFKEAALIIECKLTALITANPGDFHSHEAIDYINEAYKEASDYRKIVFGEITRVWIHIH